MKNGRSRLVGVFCYSHKAGHRYFNINLHEDEFVHVLN